MNFKTTIVLLILLLGVGGYLFVTRDKPKPDETAAKTDPQKLLDFSASDVQSINIQPADGKTISISKTQSPATVDLMTIGQATSPWSMTQPYKTYADESKVSALIEALTTATSTSQIPLGNNAADYGLDTPQYKISLATDTKKVDLNIGRQVKAGNALYVQNADATVVNVVSADLLDRIGVTPESLRLTKLINANGGSVKSLHIARATDDLTLTQTSAGWQLTASGTGTNGTPTTMPAEPADVTSLISALSGLNAVTFADAGDDINLLMGRPRATVTVSSNSPTTQPNGGNGVETVEFGGPDSLLKQSYWVRVSPPGIVAKVSKESMDSILKGSLDLRSREIVKIDPASVTELSVQRTIPATTQPTTREAIVRTIAVTRRAPQPASLVAGPILPSTQPGTMASTQPSTEPSTEPIVIVSTQPSSVWAIAGRFDQDADDAKVDAALAALNPLRVDKYRDEAPAKPRGAAALVYTVTIKTKDQQQVEFTLSDPGESSNLPVSGVYNGTIFEVPRSVITALDVDFKKAPTP